MTYQFFLKTFIKTTFIFSIFAISACVGFTNNDGSSQIRIVDLNGNAKPVKRFVPEGNAQILSDQQVSTDNLKPIENQVAEERTPVIEPIMSQNLNNAPPLAKTDVQIENLAMNTPVENIDINPNQISTPTPTKSLNQEAEVSYNMSSSDQTEEPASNNNIVTKNNVLEVKTNPVKKFKLTSGQQSSSMDTPEQISTPIISSGEPKKSGIFIQIGSFGVKQNAVNALNDAKEINKGAIQELNLGNGTSYRVVLGPISTQKKAKNILGKVRNSGYKDAFIVK